MVDRRNQSDAEACSHGRLQARALGRNSFDVKLSFSPAAPSRRNRRPMRAGPRMPQKSTNLVRSFRRKNVLKLASLLLDFRFAVHGQAVGKQPLRQQMAANDAARPFVAPRSQL